MNVMLFSYVYPVVYFRPEFRNLARELGCNGLPLPVLLLVFYYYYHYCICSATAPSTTTTTDGTITSTTASVLLLLQSWSQCTGQLVETSRRSFIQLSRQKSPQFLNLWFCKCRIWSFGRIGHEDLYLLRYNADQSVRSQRLYCLAYSSCSS
jgi:hypothetical protein